MRPTAGERVPAHWLRPNHVTRLPRRWVCLDAEAIREATPSGERQTFRLAVVSFDHQDRKGDPAQPTQWAVLRAAQDVWRWIDERCVNGRRTVVVAHNVGYDLRVTEAFRWLPALGWELVSIRLDGGQAWCQWRAGRRSLVCVDSVSWFGVGLADVGVAIGLGKRDLPDDADDDDAWVTRCRRDVEILRQAWLDVVGWVEEADQGSWKPTGAGQGWAAFRHRHLSTKLLHHGVEAVAAAEREAAWTGRCEAWRWGRLTGGPWYEMDFRSAYAQVCADEAIPTRLLGRVGPKEALRALEGSQSRATLIRARIDTPAPVVPTRGAEGVVWPVGRFTSWLWDIEAAEVIAAGGTVTPIEGWAYRAEPALRPWAEWVLDTLDGSGDPVPAAVRLVVKGWSRSLIGRFGSRWSEWEDFGESHGADVVLSTLLDGDAGTSRRLLMLGERCLAETEPHDAPDSCVFIMSYVMAVCRCRLLAAMRVAGAEHLAYVDTDGLLVDRGGRERLEAADIPGLRLKSAWRRVEVLGPRQLVLDGRLRAAGVPKGARRIGPSSWAGSVWRTLGGSLSDRDPGSVTVTDRTWVLKGVDHRRQHLVGGRTAPFAVDLDG